MRAFVFGILVLLFGSGCSLWPWKSGKNSSATTQSAGSTNLLLISNIGKVAMVNRASHFVVVTFSPGEVPAAGQTLGIFRHGEKIGEAKVTGPQHDNNTVADIVSGQPQAGDEVRAN
jgi:hypothetical protein